MNYPCVLSALTFLPLIGGIIILLTDQQNGKLHRTLATGF